MLWLMRSANSFGRCGFRSRDAAEYRPSLLSDRMTFGPKRTSVLHYRMSAFGGKADIETRCRMKLMPTRHPPRITSFLDLKYCDA
jgi:hypothetical protein